MERDIWISIPELTTPPKLAASLKDNSGSVTGASCIPTKHTRNAPTYFSPTWHESGCYRLCAITTAGFLCTVFGAGQVSTVVGLIVSTSLLALNAYTKNYDLGELAQKHKQAANDLWVIREKFLPFLVDIAMKERPLEALQEQRDKLIEQLHTVYSGAPSTTFKAYKKAQKGLKTLEDMTFSDAEIDAFLPKELKRGSSPA